MRDRVRNVSVNTLPLPPAAPPHWDTINHHSKQFPATRQKFKYRSKKSNRVCSTADCLNIRSINICGISKTQKQCKYFWSLEDDSGVCSDKSSNIRQSVSSKYEMCNIDKRLLRNAISPSRHTLRLAQNPFQNTSAAVHLSDGICFCGGLETITYAHLNSYYHFALTTSMYVFNRAFKNHRSVFIWKSTKSRHKLWFRVCLACHKTR